MASKLSDLERAAIAEAIRAGKPRNEIAREFERSGYTITMVAREFNLAFNRLEMHHATDAIVAEAASRRALLAQKLLDDIDWLRSRLRQPHKVIGFTGGEACEVVVPEAPAGDVRNYFSAIGIALDRHLALDRHDRTDEGLSAVDVFLREVMVTRTP